MTTGRQSLLVVAAASATVAVTVVSLVALALAALSRHARRPTSGAVSAGLVSALLCIASALLVVGYGLYVVAA